MLTKERITELLVYKSGSLFWKQKNSHKSSRAVVGKRAGCTKKHTGYRQLVIDKKLYLEHRVIWLLFKGEVPTGYVIDHKDRNPGNNKIENLRLATVSQNSSNTKKSSDNTSGYKGVSLERNKPNKMWRASIKADKKVKRIGYFATAELAHEAYKKAAIELHGEFASFG